MDNSLQRFIDAQEKYYGAALAEITAGKKRTHWIWFIFPQVKGLGFSQHSQYYGITDLAEATAYLAHPVLGRRLVEISNVLLNLQSNDAHSIFGSPDDMKLQSCMTLFDAVPGSDKVFKAVLDKFFDGKKDQKSLRIAEVK